MFYCHELHLPDPLGSCIELLLGPASSPADSLLLLHHIDPVVSGRKALSSALLLVSEILLLFLLSCSLLSEIGILSLGFDRRHPLVPQGSDLNLLLDPGDRLGGSFQLLLSNPCMWHFPPPPSCYLLSDLSNIIPARTDKHLCSYFFTVFSMTTPEACTITVAVPGGRLQYWGINPSPSFTATLSPP